jgi:hypothetical protein
MDGVDGVSSCPPQTAVYDHCHQSIHNEAQPLVRTPTPPRQAKGPEVLLRQAREDQNEIETYQGNLQAVKGQCVIYRIRGQEDWQHDFSACRQVAKWEYIHTKREVLRRTQRKWVRNYDACFHCYQPQTIYSRHENGTCLYEDLVMQAVFALYQEEKVSQWLWREFRVQFTETEECLIWAGKTSKLGGTVCVNGVVVLHRILKGLATQCSQTYHVSWPAFPIDHRVG